MTSEFDRMVALESDVPGFKVIRADSGMLPTLATAFVHMMQEPRNPNQSFLFETPERRRIMADYLDAHDYRRDDTLHGSWVNIADWSHLVPDAQ